VSFGSIAMLFAQNIIMCGEAKNRGSLRSEEINFNLVGPRGCERVYLQE
jgi:hypothetical protein